MQAINKNFQATNSNASKLLTDLVFGINSLKSKIISPEDIVDVLNTDFKGHVKRDLPLGYAFEMLLKKIKENISDEIEMEIRFRCTEFLISLIDELRKRLPENYQILKQIDIFSVDKILNAKKGSVIQILNLFKLPVTQIEELILQYNTIHLLKWENTDCTLKFWAEANNYVDSGGNHRFKSLATFVLSLLSLPWSNAEVERVFSQMNIVKSKLRNSMNIDTLNSILHIRYGLRRSNKCCHNFEVPPKYLNLIGTNNSYTLEENMDFIELDNCLSIFK
ncbi:uncharacterized protein LOC124460436 [Drosophila willistoni]|uniref:uncharacterized protein LOC124460436 n=1 Tax=Drosophila willistoni TaxID=7260 RepID=UPI001F081269|nr:uncharacterized protein LOC124460436 [Drosophila willistoni]